MVLTRTLLALLLPVLAHAADPAYVRARYTFNGQDFVDSSTYANDGTGVGVNIFASWNANCPTRGSFALVSTTTVNHFILPAALRTSLSTSAATVAQVQIYKTAQVINSYIFSANDTGLWLLQVGAMDDVVRFRANATELSYDTSGGLTGACAIITLVGTSAKMEIWLSLNGAPASKVASNGSDGRLSTNTLFRVGTFHDLTAVTTFNGSIDNVIFLDTDLGVWPYNPNPAQPLSPHMDRSNSPNMMPPRRYPLGIGPWSLLLLPFAPSQAHALSSDGYAERRQNLDRASADRQARLRTRHTPTCTVTPGRARTATPTPTPTI